MSKNRVLLSVITVVAVVSMASEAATAQLFSGRLFGRRNAACCAPAPAPAPSCCGNVVSAAPAPVATAAPCCGAAAPAPVIASAPATVVGTPAPIMTSAPMVMSAPVMTSAPIMMSAPVSSCCGGAIVNAPMMGVPAMGMGTTIDGTVMTVDPLPVEGSVVAGETILETDSTVQSSPSDSTVTSDVVEPPVGADASAVAPEEQN